MRVRDTKRWGIGKLYPSNQEFLESKVSGGLHTIQVGNLLVDLLVKDRESDVTLIFFHASVTKRSTYPVLVGDGMAKAAGANLISISDPILAYTDELRLGWFLGVKPIGSFPEFLKPLLLHAVDGLGTKRVIIAGSSGGGYAAINFSRFFKGAAVLCINPRLHLGARPAPRLADFMVHAYKASGRTQYARLKSTYVTEDLATYFPDGLANQVGLLQNSGDIDYYEGQFTPFVEALRPEKNLWTRLDYIGEGHVPYPKEILHGVFGNLGNRNFTIAEAFEASGFRNE